jgi:phenylalanyl-tRNA synthetase beta chain
MRTSFNWLKQYVEISATPEEVAKRLTMVGLEVESVEYLGKKYDNFVIGYVVDVQKHPNANKLTICKVNVGIEELQIVCGAPNVSAGQKIIVGKIGAVVPHNQHDPGAKPFTLTRAKIRGIESFGMICSAFEMGLGEDASGIFILDENAVVGTSLAEYLNEDDVVFEIGITPNRPDAMSHIGIAREIAALFNANLKLPGIQIAEGETLVANHASVDVQDLENCPRYTARVMFNVKIGPSPAWLQVFLKAIGLRPVNIIVDITNFVLMEVGHPIHAFDYDKLSGHVIQIRPATEGEVFVTLDHKQRKLRRDTLMICDDSGSVAIAGVMGGMNSEISNLTKNVLIESAYFNSKNIRKTSKHFGLSTDASQRFERGCDPNVTEWAANRVASLIQELAGGELLKGSIDIYPTQTEPLKIPLRLTKTNEVLGTTLDSESVCNLLQKIGVRRVDVATQNHRGLMFEIPTFRPDITQEIDLIEEVARLHGYDNIEVDHRASIQLPDTADPKSIVDSIKESLIGNGYHEVVSNSMQPKSLASMMSKDFIEVANPLSMDMASLRTSLVPNALQIVKNNISHGTPNMRFFEVGKTYFVEHNKSETRWIPGYREEDRLVLVITGTIDRITWSEVSPRKVDIYDLKGEIEVLCEKISLDKFKFIPYTTSNALSNLGLYVEIYGENRGFLGKIRGDILKQFDIEQDVYVAEISFEKNASDIPTVKKFKPLPEYPSVLRDIAIITDDALPASELLQAIHEAGGLLLKDIQLFDIYRGNQVPPGKKSSAFALEFQSLEKTLSQEEIDTIMSKIMDNVSSKFNATLRM